MPNSISYLSTLLTTLGCHSKPKKIQQPIRIEHQNLEISSANQNPESKRRKNTRELSAKAEAPSQL